MMYISYGNQLQIYTMLTESYMGRLKGEEAVKAYDDHDI